MKKELLNKFDDINNHFINMITQTEEAYKKVNELNDELSKYSSLFGDKDVIVKVDKMEELSQKFIEVVEEHYE